MEDRHVMYNDYSMQNMGMLNVTRILDWSDNGKMLRCIANHIALDKPLENTKLLNVYCKFFIS